MLLALLVGSTAVVGCGDDDGSASAGGDGETVRVGAILSTSGAYSNLGTEGELALDAFAETWRFSDGRRIEFEIVNDQSDPTQAAGAGPTLREQGVTAIIGPSSGAAMAAALPVLKELGVPVMLGPPLPYPKFNEEPWVFSPNIHQVAPTQLEDFRTYIEDLGPSNPVVITNDDASGEAITKSWGEAGFATEVVPLDVTNYQPVLSQLREDGHDALVTIGASGEPPAHVSRAKDAMGWDVDQFLAPSNLVEDYLTLAGDAAEGSRGFLWPVGAGSDYFADSEPEQAEAIRVIEKALPNADIALHANTGYYWDHALSIATAIEETGSTDPEELRDALETQELWGVNGFISRSPDDHVGYQQESAIRAIVQDGKIVPADDA